MNPTCTSRLPCAASASMMFRHASGVVASGFSQNTGLPAAIAATTYASCDGPQEHTRTASTRSSPMRSSPVGCTTASRSRDATSFATCSLASETATTSAPDTTCVSRRMWSWPIMPVPITPTRNVTVTPLPVGWCGGSAPQSASSVRPAPDRTQPAADVVAGGPGPDGQRDVGFDGVEVLLDHREHVAVEVAERGQQWRHVGLAVRRLAHDAELDRLGERDVLGEDAGTDH